MGLLNSVAGLFPSTLFSTGGDEINARCYADDAQTQRDLNGQTLEQALDAFTQATHDALKDLGKTPVVWEGATYLFCTLYGVLTREMFCCLGIIEMVLNYNLTLSDDTIVMYVTGHLSPTCALTMFIARVWISSSDAAAVAAKGFHIVHAASNSFYLVRSIPLSHHPTLPAELTTPTLSGIGLWYRQLFGKRPHSEQLV